MLKDPFKQFNNWFREAERSKAIEDHTAACLSTLDVQGYPDGRMVLLKDFDARGFVFYTNLQSEKGQAIKKTPRAALTFHWAPLQKQVRIQGTTEPVTAAEADAYWSSRSRLSQLGAWASKQSQELPSRAILLQDVAKLALQYGLRPVPRPPHWSGIRLVPKRIEFWHGRINRLHDRFLYTPAPGGSWNITRLYP